MFLSICTKNGSWIRKEKTILKRRHHTKNKELSTKAKLILAILMTENSLHFMCLLGRKYQSQHCWNNLSFQYSFIRGEWNHHDFVWALQLNNLWSFCDYYSTQGHCQLLYISLTVIMKDCYRERFSGIKTIILETPMLSIK